MSEDYGTWTEDINLTEDGVSEGYEPGESEVPEEVRDDLEKRRVTNPGTAESRSEGDLEGFLSYIQEVRPLSEEELTQIERERVFSIVELLEPNQSDVWGKINGGTEYEVTGLNDTEGIGYAVVRPGSKSGAAGLTYAEFIEPADRFMEESL